MSDPYYASVSLLLHLNGADTSTSFPDVSPSPKTATVSGGAQIKTAQSKFGGASLKTVADTTDGITFPTGADFLFGTGDFTIELFFRPTAEDIANGGYLITGWGTGNPTNAFALFMYSAGTVRFNSSGVVTLTTTTAMVADTWYHVAVSRNGDVFRLFLDGVQEATQTNSVSLGTPVYPIVVGAGNISGSVNTPSDGYIDEVRITKGVGRYSTGFTPTTSEFESTSSTAVLILPAITLSATGNLITANANLTLPAITGSAFGGASAALVLPAITAVMTGHNTEGENSLTAILPALSLEAYGAGSASMMLPAIELAVTGSFVVLGRAELQLPALQATASGFGGATARGEMTLPAFDAIGYSGAVLAVTLGGITIEASGTAGSVGNAAMTLPLFELEAEATRQNSGQADLILPALEMSPTGKALLILPGFTLTAIGTAVVTATYEAYAINLIHKGVKDPVDEVTRYTNFPFERIVRYQNSYFGVAADGLYLLEGTTDHATAATTIPWEFKTHLTDFENPKEKTVVSAYFGGRMGKAETITLYAGEKTTKAYKYKTTRGSTAQNHREKFGRGIKARYFAVGANGADVMELDNIEFNIHSLTRRI